jgi:hypothetical protein
MRETTMQNIEKWIYEIGAHRAMTRQKALTKGAFHSMKSIYKRKITHNPALTVP